MDHHKSNHAATIPEKKKKKSILEIKPEHFGAELNLSEKIDDASTAVSFHNIKY